MAKLAILGGKQAVNRPHPHYEWPKISQEEIDAVKNLMEHGQISFWGRTGPIKDLEDDFASYHNVKHSLCLSSGAASLHSAYFGVGIGPGDEVVAPTYTFITTVTPLLQLHGIPILCDCDPETGNIDPEDIRKKITKRTKAIVVTHMWGHPVEMDEVLQIAQEFDLTVIEDCAHALGATYKGKKVGTIGDVACFSLGTGKIITGGYGGMLCTNDQEIYERATLLGYYRIGQQQTVLSDKYKPFTDSGYGLNYAMHPFAAVMIRIQLKDLQRRISLRKQNLDYFTNRLYGVKGIKPPVTKSWVTRGAYYGYKPYYLSEQLEGIPIELYIKALQAEGVEIHRPGSISNGRIFITINHNSCSISK